jgi:long-chain acyl-CoA synthetase
MEPWLDREETQMERPWLQHYDVGVPAHLDYPQRTMDQILAESAGRAPGAVLTLFKGGRLTYEQVDRLVDRMTGGLQALGLQRGDRVAIHLPNCPQFVVAYYAILRAGGIAVPCNPAYVGREMEHQLNDAGAKMAITMSSFYPVVRGIRARTSLRQVIVAKLKTYLPMPLRLLFALFRERRDGHALRISGEANTHWFSEVLQSAPSQPRRADIGLDETAVLMYTGGTTGIPKGAQLTHRNLVVNATQCAHWLRTTERGASLLTALPLFHSYAMTTCMNHAVLVGGSMILVPDPRDLGDVLGTIHKYRPTVYPGVPAMYVAINNNQDAASGKYDLGSIEACISGAAGLPAEVQERFRQISGAHLVEGYGLSEASPVTHINPVFDRGPDGFIGIPVPDTEAKIVDLQTGTQELPAGEIGELCVRGPQVMKGYWNVPSETADVLRDGWLYTGDIATMTEDGYFQLVDRKKDIILGAGGYNIYPREIEDVLYEHPKVKEAVAAGIPWGEKGERVKVWVVLKEGQEATSEEILHHCDDRLAPYKRPKVVEFRKDLPKTMVGKMLRRLLVAEEAKAADG